MSLLPLSIALFAHLVSAHGAHPAVLRVGQPGLSEAEVRRSVERFGTVAKRLEDGYFRIILDKTSDVARAKRELKKAGFDFVFDDHDRVDRTSLKSIQRHIAYVRGRNKILGLEPELEEGDKGEREEPGLDFYEALEFYLKMRVGPDGKLNRQEMMRAIQQRDALPDAPVAHGQSHGPAGQWAYVGPTNVGVPYSTYYGLPPLSGRKGDVAVAKSDPNTMYVASASGGVFKSTDGGVNWTAKGDKWPFLQSSSVAVHPTNKDLVLVGTGDNEGFNTQQTCGIMRSADGGSTWAQVGTGEMKQACICKIMFDPGNPNIILCIAANKGGQGADIGGIFKSIDAGLTWTKKQGGYYFEDLDVAINGTYYACAVTADASDTGHLYKSTNKGDTWVELAANPCVANEGNLGMVCSQNNANVLYLLSIGDEEIYKSTNAGASLAGWTSIKGDFKNGGDPGANYNWAQKDYNYWIGCMDQGTQDVVLVGLIGINQDVGGDGTWTDISKTYNFALPNYVHSDQHSFARHPTDANVAYFMSDGGLFKYTFSANPVEANFTPLNKNIADFQVYHMAVHPTDSSYLLCGVQDNSSPASYGNLATWPNLGGGDGGYCVFDRNDPGVHYVTSQYCGISRYPTANAPAPDASPAPPFALLDPPECAFFAPIVIGGNGSQLYTASNRVYRWNGTGNDFTIIGPPNLGNGTTDYCNLMEVHPSNNSVMHSGTASGIIYRTFDAWNTWKQIDAGVFDRPIGSVSVNPGNWNEVLVGLQGGGSDHLWRCTNTGAATPVYTNVSGTSPYKLPDTPINSVARDPFEASRWYVATDVGVFMTSNNGVSWFNMQSLGLPNVAVNDLKVNAAKTYLYAGTFGRGIWRMPLTSTPGTYSISGNVKTVGNANFQGVDVFLRRKSTWAIPTYTANPNLPIPDNHVGGVESDIQVTQTNVVSGGSISVDITHPNKGDVDITLFSPDGQQVTLKQADGASGTNIVATYDIGYAFRGIKANGQWSVVVRDLASGNVGTFNQWKLNLKYDDYATVAKQVTGAAGNYSFTNQVAGLYMVFPQKPGKTWTPAQRFPVVGPSVTGQDFKANQ